MLTTNGLSGSGSATQVAISLGLVIVLYSTIGVIAAVLMVRHARRGLVDEPDQPTPAPNSSGPFLWPNPLGRILWAGFRRTGPSVPSLTYEDDARMTKAGDDT